MASRRSWSVSVLARKLGDERRRLDELHAGDLAVTATFELGYAHLTPEQAWAFRHLSVADAPDLSSSAAEALLGTRAVGGKRPVQPLGHSPQARRHQQTGAARTR
ncbi:hypothetical protein [Streptomyces triculaminicus]|uniref:hypothetical protein n=1 Tax=Streptomyces triculaminicus TaxID=2816232 RepID=UPI0037CD5C44